MAHFPAIDFRLAFFVLYRATILVPGGSSEALGQGSTDDRPDDKEGPIAGLWVSNNHPFAILESLSFALPPELAGSECSLLAVSNSFTPGTVEAHYISIQADPASRIGPARA